MPSLILGSRSLAAWSGRTLVVGVTGAEPALAAGVDLLVIESTYLDADRHLATSHGHLTALRRTRIGPFDLTAACPDIFADDADAPTPMTMAEAARLSFPVVEVTDDQEAAIRVGRRVDMIVPADVTAMIAGTGEMLALYRPDGERRGQSRAICVLV